MILCYTDCYEGHSRSRELLEQAIRLYLTERGTDPGSAAREAADLIGKITIGEHGKPSIPGFPQFSVTHSGRWWAVLIGGEEPVGLDLQEERPDGRDLEKLADRFFDPADAEAVRREGAGVFWRIWTRREAVIKALGRTVISPVPAVCDAETVCLGGRKWFYRKIELAPDLHGEACVTAPEEIRYIRMNTGEEDLRI